MGAVRGLVVCIVAFLVVIASLLIAEGHRTDIERTQCEAKGGVAVYANKIFCVKPEALINTK